MGGRSGYKDPIWWPVSCKDRCAATVIAAIATDASLAIVARLQRQTQTPHAVEPSGAFCPLPKLLCGLCRRLFLRFVRLLPFSQSVVFEHDEWRQQITDDPARAGLNFDGHRHTWLESDELVFDLHVRTVE